MPKGKIGTYLILNIYYAHMTLQIEEKIRKVHL
jgi:hypothetical protein